MIQDINSVFSDITLRVKRSAIREVLKLTQCPDIISFAGGLPAPESFPVEELKEISVEVLDEAGPAALQYTTTEGDPKLRRLITERYKAQGLEISKDNVLVTTASQQGLDLVGKVFINPGDIVICGLPSYLGGLSSFTSYGAKLEGIQFDEKGMRADDLEEKLSKLKAQNKKPKFIYIIPDFQNPAGITMPECRRKDIIEIAKKYDILIIEDSPYRELRFEGEHQTMLNAMDNTGHVVTLGSFSKIFAPGFRLGFVIAHPDIIDKFVVAKQTADLCTPTYIQKIAAKYIEKGYLDKNIKGVISSYKEKKDLMLKCFDETMPEGVTWTKPEGGLFLFLNLPKGMDAEKLFNRALEKKVAFVFGSVFHCDGSGENTLRMNFSFASKEQIIEGVKRLAESIKEEMNQ